MNPWIKLACLFITVLAVYCGVIINYLLLKYNLQDSSIWLKVGVTIFLATLITSSIVNMPRGEKK